MCFMSEKSSTPYLKEHVRYGISVLFTYSQIIYLHDIVPQVNLRIFTVAGQAIPAS